LYLNIKQLKKITSSPETVTENKYRTKWNVPFLLKYNRCDQSSLMVIKLKQLIHILSK